MSHLFLYPSCTPPLFPATDAQLDLLRLLVKEGVDVAAPDHKGRSPVHVAAHKNQVGAIAVLAQATARPKSSSSSPRGAGSSSVSAGGGSAPPALDLNAKDANGESPLHHAVMARHPEAVGFLCDAGVDMGVVDAAGKTPCWHAGESGEVT